MYPVHIQDEKCQYFLDRRRRRRDATSRVTWPNNHCYDVTTFFAAFDFWLHTVCSFCSPKTYYSALTRRRWQVNSSENFRGLRSTYSYFTSRPIIVLRLKNVLDPQFLVRRLPCYILTHRLLLDSSIYDMITPWSCKTVVYLLYPGHRPFFASLHLAPVRVRWEIWSQESLSPKDHGHHLIYSQSGQRRRLEKAIEIWIKEHQLVLDITLYRTMEEQ